MRLINRYIAGAALLSIMSAGVATSSVSAQTAARGGKDEGGVAGAGIPLLTTTRVASGLIRPIFATYAPGDATRLFIIEKRGLIRVLKIDTNPPTLLDTAFLDIDALCAGGTTQGSEQGLLGLAFHPNYQQNGYFFVYYTANGGADTIARYQVSANPDVANTTGTILLSWPDSESNHNGGWLAFRPDDTQGYLYVTIGDGGSSCDSGAQHNATIGNGQSLNTLFGKMHRIDIDGPDNIVGTADDDDFPADVSRNYAIPPSNPFALGGGMGEIWDYGLRNPWRCAFDRVTNDLYIADVGQGVWEEVNFEPANSTGGKNYGWRCMEGNHPSSASGCSTANCATTSCGGSLICPVFEYSHGATTCSITGGVVYRGSAIPALQGTYFFADYNCSLTGPSPIWSFKIVGGVVTNYLDRTNELAPGSGLVIDTLTSFGEDLAGEIYICDQEGGEVFKIIPRPCLADINGDGTRGVADLLAVITSWGPCAAPPAACPADVNGSGTVDVADLLAVIINWGACP